MEPTINIADIYNYCKHSLEMLEKYQKIESLDVRIFAKGTSLKKYFNDSLKISKNLIKEERLKVKFSEFTETGLILFFDVCKQYEEYKNEIAKSDVSLL